VAGSSAVGTWMSARGMPQKKKIQMEEEDDNIPEAQKHNDIEN
jgi:hypothetical protein